MKVVIILSKFYVSKYKNIFKNQNFVVHRVIFKLVVESVKLGPGLLRKFTNFF